MIQELLIGLFSNMLFSAVLFAYNRKYNHKYDEITRKLIYLENLSQNNDNQLKYIIAWTESQNSVPAKFVNHNSVHKFY